MRTNFSCAKCQSKDLIKVPGNVGAFGAGHNIPVGWRAMNAVPVTRLVCGACGFTEQWIQDPKDLERVRKAYAAKPER